MKNLKRISTINGFILPMLLISLSFVVWVFSIYLLGFKEESEKIKIRKLTNDRLWKLENISIVAEYELYKGDLKINNGDYIDIIQYFEGKNKAWRFKNAISESGYKRKLVTLNNKTIDGDIILERSKKNILNIILEKDIAVKNGKEKYKIIIHLYYEYPLNETDLEKNIKREIIKVEVESENN